MVSVVSHSDEIRILRERTERLERIARGELGDRIESLSTHSGYISIKLRGENSNIEVYAMTSSVMGAVKIADPRLYDHAMVLARKYEEAEKRIWALHKEYEETQRTEMPAISPR